MIKDEKGQSLTEFALVVPLLLLLICGIFDFGRYMFSYINLNMDAQEAVRLGGLGKKDIEITAYAQNHASVSNPTMLQVTIYPTEMNRKSGDYVKVSLQYSQPFITPVISKFLPVPVIKAESTIRVE
jgi:Flp pilus assembly protein TadG